MESRVAAFSVQTLELNIPIAIVVQLENGIASTVAYASEIPSPDRRHRSLGRGNTTGY